MYYVLYPTEIYSDKLAKHVHKENRVLRSFLW